MDSGLEYREQGTEEWDTENVDPPDIGTSTSTTISGLTPGTTYQVHVMAKNDEGVGEWSEPGAETTASLVVAYSPATYSVNEGHSVEITVTLTQAATEALKIPINVEGGGTAETGDYQMARLTDGDLAFAADDTSQTFTVKAEEDGDQRNETVILGFGELPEGVKAGSLNTATVTIVDDDTEPIGGGNSGGGNGGNSGGSSGGGGGSSSSTPNTPVTRADEEPPEETPIEEEVDGSDDNDVVDDGSGGAGAANQAPVFTEGDRTERIVAEQAAKGTNIGAPVTATDADGDGDPLTYTRGGVEAAFFAIDKVPFERMIVERRRDNILTGSNIRNLMRLVDEEMDRVAKEQPERPERESRGTRLDSAQEDLGQYVGVQDRLGGAVVHHPAVFQDVSPVDDVQDALDVVLNDDDRGIEPLADVRDFLKHLFDHDGREAQRGFVEQQHLRAGHEAAAQGQHLLLPAGHLAGQVAALLLQDGEEFHDRVQAAFLFHPVVEVQATHFQVLLDGEVGEDPPALGHEGDSLLHHLMGGRHQRVLPPVDAAAAHRGESHDGLQNGGLPGPVGAHYRHHLALPHPHRNLFQSGHGSVVHGHVDQFEKRGPIVGRIYGSHPAHLRIEIAKSLEPIPLELIRQGKRRSPLRC